MDNLLQASSIQRKCLYIYINYNIIIVRLASRRTYISA